MKRPRIKCISFPARLKLARFSAGLNVEQLAKLVGYDATLVLRWEQGDREPGLAQLDSLCNVLGESADWLLGRNAKRRNP